MPRITITDDHGAVVTEIHEIGDLEKPAARIKLINAIKHALRRAKAEDDRDRVDAAFGCPKCGERHVDALIWIDDETVACQTCGRQYQP